ncbi:hypothetical protein IGJ00_002681 [Enterococcus sp. AZ062]|nr:Uncharacterised protein [Enterococcus mundtii]
MIVFNRVKKPGIPKVLNDFGIPGFFKYDFF